MILTFSQGIVTHSTVSGTPGDTPNFLVAVATNSKVDLHAPLDQPFQLAYAHRDTNYLLTIRESGDVNAWGYGNTANHNAPFAVGDGSGQNLDEFYLYVDIDRVTGLTSYGWTKDQPVEGSTPPNSINPANRQNQQHWFDTSNNVMFVWQASGVPPTYGRFTETIRCFVAKYKLGGGFTSMSTNAPSFIGTTVGIAGGSYRVGSLIFDIDGNVLKRTTAGNKNTFFTTEDIFASGLPTSSRTRLESFVIDGIAQSPIAAYQAVYFSGLNKLLPLTPYVQDNVIFGLIEQEAGAAGDLVKVTTDGVINNPTWSWTDVNEQIYVDSAQPGVLTSVQKGYNPLPNQKPIAVAIDATTILLRASELLLATGGIDTFVELLDTPNGYTGDSERLVKVNASETDLEFGAELSNLDDVDVLTPAPGHVMYYGASSSLWESNPPGAISGVQAWDIHLDQLAAATPTTGNALIYEGSPLTWTARDLVEADISDLGDYLPDPGSNGIVIRDSASTTVPRSVVSTHSASIAVTNGDGVAGNISLLAGANLRDIADLSAATDQFIVGLSGNFIARTPAEIKTILSYNLSEMGDINFTGSPAAPVNGDVLTYTGTEWQALAPATPSVALSDLTDINFTGSPAAPVNGDVLTYTGTEWQALAPTGGGLPSSVTECNILAADGAGGWNEQAIMDLPVPYDMVAQSLGTIPTDTIIMKAKMPRAAVIVDYGHQMDVELGPGGSPPDSTFFVTLNGTTTTGSPNDVIGTMTFDDTGNNPHFDFFNTFTYLNAGDIIRIISPVGNNTGLEDVGLTLRAFVEPVIPCGTLSVSWGASQYNNPTSTNGVTVTGSYTHIEFAVTHASSDGVTYYALNDGNGHTFGSGIGVRFDGIDIDNESKYFVSTSPIVSAREITSSGIYYRVRCTAFGPGGIETDTTVFSFVGGGA